MAKQQEFNPQSHEVNNGDANGYFLCVDARGKMTCSCGRELVKHDENSWMCPGGYPIYKPEEADLIKDKYGRLMMRNKSHDRGQSSEN